MTAPTERELQLSRLTGESVARLRYFMARGFHYDRWGNCSYISMEAAARPAVDEAEGATRPVPSAALLTEVAA